MVFSSALFLFFFLPAVLFGYFTIRQELKNVFLLVASLLFYALGEPFFVLIMMLSILWNYLFGIVLGKGRYRRFVLVAAILGNLLLLVYYKYYDFFITNINYILGTGFAVHHTKLPIGISFFTFQGMSYLFDVYFGRVAYQKNPLNISLYISFFPQLIAGPIVRYQDVNEAIESRRETVEDICFGVERFIKGLAKKVLLANSFALLADTAFQLPTESLGMGMAWLGAVGYTLQIFFDFSGYSDMAIGLARIFGFRIPENFNYPYIAVSAQDFWHRWHISLSTWFRDYVYIPMGGNRTGNVYVHLLTVFFLTGLWHGASWNFVVWGLWHGAFLIAERIFRHTDCSWNLPIGLRWGYAMLIVVCGWVFFRADNLSHAVAYLSCMFVGRFDDLLRAIFWLREFSILFLIAVVGCLPPSMRFYDLFIHNDRVKAWLQSVTLWIAFVLSVGVLSITSYDPFIYFNF